MLRRPPHYPPHAFPPQYTTGFGLNSAKTDKGAGVVALTLVDLRRRGLLGPLHLAGVNGRKLPEIRAHMARAIGEAYPASGFDLGMATYPGDDEVDAAAYRRALAVLPRGSAVTVFTPDNTHFEIALDCVRAGMHVLVTKPVCMTLREHATLAAAAEEAGVLVAVEVHKRWDPIYRCGRAPVAAVVGADRWRCGAAATSPAYARISALASPHPPRWRRRSDARDRLRRLGDFSFLNAYMSQPKLQLSTFKAWAGLTSDIRCVGDTLVGVVARGREERE
jgi:D-galacturonate reductase